MAAPTFITHATTSVSASTTLTITKPASVQDNDYLLVHIQHGTGNLAADPTPPSGWALVGTRQANSSTTAWFYEKIASSEPASWQWTAFSSGVIFGGIVVSRGADQTTPRNQTHILMNTSISGTSVALTVTTTLADCLLVAFAGQDQTSAGATYTQASMTELYDGDFETALLHCGAYHETVTTATTYARTISYTAERCCGALFAIAPSAGQTGSAVAAFGFTGAGNGVDRALGTAAASFGFSGVAAGVDRALGTAGAALGFTATAAGIDRAVGIATGSFGFTATAAGSVGGPPVTGQAVAAFGFAATTAGVPRTPGQAAAAFGFTATSSGIDRSLGLAVTTFGFAAASSGRPRVVGLAIASFVFAATAAGTPRTGGAAAATFGFAATAQGLAGEPRDITVIASIRNNHVTGGVRLTNLVAEVRSNHITGGVTVPRGLRTGSVEYVTADMTFVGETAATIASTTGQVQITTTDTTPTAADPNWVAADVTERTDVTGGALLALKKLHTAGAAGTYRLWAKVSDNPEIPILLCGSFDVR